MKRLLPLLALLVAPLFAGTATIAWQAPTQNTDSTPITAPLTYTVYGAPCGTPKAPLAAGLSTLTYTQSNVPVGAFCWTVTATADGQESAPSAEVSKTITAPTPRPPIITSVTLTAYKLRQAKDGISFVAIGTIPPGTPCDTTHSVDGYSIVPRDSVTMSVSFDSKPLVTYALCI